MTLHPQYITDEQQNKKAVVLPMAEWEAVLEALEELEDIRRYDEAVQRTDEAIPFEQAVQEITRNPNA